MDVKAILMGLSFSLMWSSAFATARIIVAAAPPLHSLALRFFCGRGNCYFNCQINGPNLAAD